MRENFPRTNAVKDSGGEREVLPEAQELQKLQEEMGRIKEEYIQLEQWGNVLLGASGWNVKISPTIKTAAADFESKTIYFGTAMETLITSDALFKKRLKRIFVSSHELMHFAQALENPEAYLGTFESAEEKANEYAEEYGISQNYLEETFGRFYNIFLDIDDNGKTVLRNKNLQKPEGNQAMHELYRDLFSEEDLSQFPLNEQFMSGVIMQIMEDGREIQMSEDVKNFLQQPMTYLGRNYESFVDFIKAEIHNPDVSFEKTVFKIDTVVRPLFEDFLKKDIENNSYRQPPANENDIDQGVEKKVLKTFAKKAKAEKDQKKTTTQDRMRKKLHDDFVEEKKDAGFSDGEIKRMEKIMQEVDSVWPSIMELWERFFLKSLEHVRKEEGWYQSGNFSTDRFVRKLPEILSEDRIENKVFSRKREVETKESWQPKKINFIFSIDLSGSMEDDQREAMQKVVYSIYRSFLQFQRNKIIASVDGETHVFGNLAVIGFGDTDKMTALFQRSEKEQREEMIDPTDKSVENRFWKALLKISHLNLGNTDNSQPLYYGQDIAEKRKQYLNDGEEVLLFLEMTDGDPDENVIADSKSLVKDLNQRENIYCKSIRFGGGSDDFKDIWSENGKPLANMNVAKLKEVFMQILYEVFKS